jgi:uncharacterized protein DUF2461
VHTRRAACAERSQPALGGAGRPEAPQGESLATAPRGYPKDHERIELVRRKSLSLGATLKSGRGISRAEGLQFVTKTWRAAAPVTGWLDEHVGASNMPMDRRRRGR